MIGKLQRVEASKEFIERVAKDEFSTYRKGDCRKGDFETQNDYTKVTYRRIAVEIIEDFNYAVDVFGRINMFCTVKEPGCWDVEEYYEE